MVFRVSNVPFRCLSVGDGSSVYWMSFQQLALNTWSPKNGAVQAEVEGTSTFCCTLLPPCVYFFFHIPFSAASARRRDVGTAVDPLEWMKKRPGLGRPENMEMDAAFAATQSSTADGYRNTGYLDHRPRQKESTGAARKSAVNRDRLPSGFGVGLRCRRLSPFWGCRFFARHLRRHRPSHFIHHPFIVAHPGLILWFHPQKALRNGRGTVSFSPFRLMIDRMPFQLRFRPSSPLRILRDAVRVSPIECNSIARWWYHQIDSAPVVYTIQRFHHHYCLSNPRATIWSVDEWENSDAII